MIGLLAMAVVVQFISFIPLISRTMDHRSIIEAHDNDAGKMIEVGLRTRWYNDNQFRYYGPLYFRLANTFHSVAPTYSGLYPADSREAQEESIHFYLLLVSVLGLFLLAFSCSWLLTSKWELRLLSVLFLTPLLAADPTWAQFIFTAHPDLMLAGFAALSAVMTYQMIEKDFSEASIRFAGWLWGATLCIKLSVLFFMPGLGLIFWIFSSSFKQTFERSKKLTLSALASYFLLGFPQNLDIFGSLRKLFNLSSFSSSFSSAAFADWWQQIGTQSVRGICLLLLISVLFSEKNKIEIPLKKYLASFLVMGLGLLILTTRTLELAHSYYTLPFIGALLVGVVFLSQNLRGLRLSERFNSAFHWNGFLFLIFILGSSFHLFSFPEAAATQASLLRCRSAYREVYNQTNTWLSQGQTMISTPYTPVPLYDEKKVQIDWELNFETLNKTSPDFLVLNSSYYARYTDQNIPNKYVLLTNADWKKTQDFYLAFTVKNPVSQDQVQAPGGAAWKKIYKNETCQLEIWQRQ